jgi:hypothetical protein
MNPMAGPVSGGPMPMAMNSGAMAAQQMQQQQQQQQQQQGGPPKSALNTYIYDYFIREGMFDLARAMLNSEQHVNVLKDSPGRRRDENGNVLGNGVGDDPMDTDSKDELDSKRPNDLPAPNIPNALQQDTCFLYEWFSLFWETLQAQRNKPSSTQVSQYISHTQVDRLDPNVILWPYLTISVDSKPTEAKSAAGDAATDAPRPTNAVQPHDEERAERHANGRQQQKHTGKDSHA